MATKTADWLTIQRWSSEELVKREPLFQQSCDAIAYQPSYAIDFGELRPLLIEHFIDNGVQYHSCTVSSIQSGKRCFIPDISEHFDAVVLALGAGTANWFPDLRITLQGGSLLQVRSSETINHFLSSNGLHLAHHHSGDVVIGSTRWTSPPPDQIQKQELLHRFKQQFPTITDVSPGTLWNGIRCIYPSDRLPLCGQLPHCKNIYVITALGSKGMLWGPLSARELRNNICYSTPISAELSLLRARAEDAWFSPNINRT